ncbi:MAG TPA: SCP2 sterol-binding domain-containing protein [Ktedonobacteraceae bacterium]|jgi:putative sterol carrier protein|nr:SCP2 sterol-binding domain-containing protein [Ktedonobacteraceae bacterium]
MANIRPYLERACERFSDPKNQESFKTFTKTLLFEFPDTQQAFTLTVVQGSASLAESTAENPDVRVTANTDVLAGIMDRTVNPMTAYMTRKIKVQGVQSDLMQLQKLLF